MKTLAHLIEDGALGEAEAPESRLACGVLKFAAPCCGSWLNGFQLVDARGWPAGFTGGVAFICDGCWTRFEREGRATGEPGHNRPFTEAVMYEWAGAPPAVVARMEEILAQRRARFADSEGARSPARERRGHASRIGIEIGKPAPAAELRERINRRDAPATAEETGNI
jgi:hypothetical protein